MVTLNCPSCGAEVTFKTRSSVFAVCSFCKSSIVRQDVDLSVIGKISDLQYDLTPLQVGTVGSFGSKTFELIGRLKIKYSDGFWNEWHALFSDGLTGWLAEAQGFYAVCFEVNNPVSAIDRDRIEVGRQILLSEGKLYEVEDMRDVICMFSEGELPFNAVQGRESLSVDLSGDALDMATIEFAKNQTRVYEGTYQDFDEFKFRNLRMIDGWKR
jgi:hypothetical protein